MAEQLSEPFFVALAHLRDTLQAGRLAPGTRIIAVDVADSLRLSATPVREALNRLAGEGLVEDRRGQGYFVPDLSAEEIADLYRLSLAILLIALDPRRISRTPAADAPLATAAAVSDPVVEVERLFRGWVAATGARVLRRDFRLLQTRLAPVRRLEPGIIPNLAAEAAALCAIAGRPERLALLRQFHATRMRLAPRLAAQQGGPPGGSER